MLDALKGLLKSRKTLLGIVGVIILMAKERLGWELDEATVYGILAFIVANIFGIAIEDAGEKMNPKNKK